jgi:protocatechuate 3,4-dioxygenase beta subunit
MENLLNPRENTSNSTARVHATVEGTITNMSGIPARDARIYIDQLSISTVTDADGHYVIDNVKPGYWRMSVSGDGFAGEERTIYIMRPDNYTQNFEMGALPNFDLSL